MKNIPVIDIKDENFKQKLAFHIWYKKLMKQCQEKYVEKKEKQMNVHFKVNDPVYGVPLEFFIGEKSRFIDYVRSKYDLTLQRYPMSCGESIILNNHKLKHPVNLIWIETFDWSICSYRVLIHEVIHATLDVMEIRGVEVGRGNNEAVTYYGAYLFGSILKKLEKYRPTKKRRR